MRIAKIYRTNSKRDKLVHIANYIQNTHKQGVVFCFSKEECEKVVTELKNCAIDAVGYYRSSKGSDSRSKNNDYDVLDEAFIGNELKTLVVPIAYKVDLSHVINRIEYILYYDRPAFMSDYIAYYDHIYMNRQAGDCFIYLVNDQVKEEYDDYFLEKAANVEMVKKIFGIYQDRCESLSEKDISKKLGCGVGKVRYSHRYLVDKGILENEYPLSTKYIMTSNYMQFDKEDIEKEYRNLEEEYLKMLKYCWQS